MDDQSTPVPESKSGVIAGLRPDITPAQIVGGIPIIADLLTAGASTRSRRRSRTR